MQGGENRAPVIIKKKKVSGGDGHHGGAWKVAYADFVTAMMAFFMLMWLLSATTEKQRKGLADYFNPTIAMNRISGGGQGSLSGDSVFAENVLARMGTGSTSFDPDREDAVNGSIRDTAPTAEEEAEFNSAKEKLLGAGGESLLEENQMKHVEIRLTDEGMIIELFDRPTAALFEDDNTPTPLLESLARVLSIVAQDVGKPVAIEAHVRAQPIVRADNPNWEDSQIRSTVMRGLMETAGVPLDQIERTTAHADREPTVKNTMSVRNNRLEVIFLRE